MFDAATEALSFVKGKERKDLDGTRILALSLVKCVEIIGEAASKITEQYRKSHPEVPWALIVATRNRLIHGYFDIDLDQVWDTVTRNLPELVSSLKPLIPSEKT